MKHTKGKECYHVLGLKAHVRTNIQSEAGKKASSDRSTDRRDQVMNTLYQHDWFVMKEGGKDTRIERGFKGCVRAPFVKIAQRHNLRMRVLGR